MFESQRQVNGSLVHITAIFGMTIGAAILRDATGIAGLDTFRFSGDSLLGRYFSHRLLRQ